LTLVQRTAAIVETTDDCEEINPYDLASGKPNLKDTGAVTNWLNYEERQTLYKEILHRVETNEPAPDSIEGKLL